MPQKLSERSVKAVEPPKTGAATIWDSEITGFGVRVFAPTNRRPQGARSFFTLTGENAVSPLAAFPNGPLRQHGTKHERFAGALTVVKTRQTKSANGARRQPSPIWPSDIESSTFRKRPRVRKRMIGR
jgi:hypothetical protein